MLVQILSSANTNKKNILNNVSIFNHIVAMYSISNDKY